ncbi:MAG: CDP-glycerol glycerophosphotransferase family protein [Chloroflexi bacterium]|nr:CDP-glycerol glycerophosphotransferase family protein [Chloroflexota bacterium]
MKSARPCVFLSIPYGISARNVLRSEAFRILRDNCRVVVLSPLHRDPAFRAEFGGPGVALCDLPRCRSPLYQTLRRMLDWAESYRFTRRTRIETLLILERCFREQAPLLYACRRAAGALLGGWDPVYRALLAVQQRSVRSRYWQDLFDEFQPGLVLLTHPFALEELPLALEARLRPLLLCAMIHSWDNVTAKSGLRVVVSNRPGRTLPVRFDKLIVWNEVMRRELVDFYGYRPEDIFPSGIPQFDVYREPDRATREELLLSLGADPARRLILYAAGSPTLLARQEAVLDVLVEAVEEDRLDVPAQLLVRTHPGTPMEALRARYAGRRRVVFDQPGIADAAAAFAAGWQNGDGDPRRLARQLRHCDVVVNVASTMSIDAAAFDKPVVCVGYDGDQVRPYLRSVAKHYDFTHYRNLMETGGVRLARSAEELVEEVRRYLREPGRDVEGRRRIVDQQCYRLDGRAGERIGMFLCALLAGGAAGDACAERMKRA